MRFNLEQRKHLAHGLQTVALGQFAFFGYHAIQVREFGWVAISVVIYITLEVLAVHSVRMRPAMNPNVVIMGAILVIALTLSLPVIFSDWINARKDRRQGSNPPGKDAV